MEMAKEERDAAQPPPQLHQKRMHYKVDLRLKEGTTKQEPLCIFRNRRFPLLKDYGNFYDREGDKKILI